jgi:hypothetical protein
MPSEHGTTSRYRYGCRCQLCCGAKSEYRKNRTRSRPAPKPKPLVVCDTCGRTFEAANARQVRCNHPDCRRKYWKDKERRRSAHLWGVIKCATCGDLFDTGPIKIGRSPKLCSNCAFTVKRRGRPPEEKQCKLCNATFVANGAQHYCTPKCQELGKKISLRKLKRQRLLAGLCARHGTAGHCEICHARNFNKANKRRGPEGARGPTRSKVEIRKLCEQQKWKCSLCGKKLDPELRGTHNMAISIDHVIPVSKGGTHDLANLAAAHRICNTKKGNRSLGPEQLRMIG